MLALAPASAADWPTSDPAAEGLDGRALLALDQELAAGGHGYVDGFLVVRHGRIVFERSYVHDYDRLFVGKDQRRGPYNYYDPDWHPYYKRGPLHTLQSVSKSVTSALIGVALRRGEIPSVDAKVLPYLAGFRLPGDPRWSAMTLRHLLTMTSGIRWDETTVAYTDPRNSCAAMEASADWVQFVLDQPMAEEPGRAFVYSSGVTQLIAEVLRQATGRLPDDYAAEHLFRPLGIDSHYWKRTPTGLADAEGGLYLTARDLARLGQLYLEDGVWKGRRILPEGWVRDSTAPAVARPAEPGQERDYGYQWWTLPYGPRRARAFAAIGYGGQLLVGIPEHDLLVVLTGWNIFDRPAVTSRFVLERVLAAVRGRAEASAAAPPADLLLDGAAVYTLDAARSWAEAVAIRDGRIVFVGGSRDARAWIGSATRVVSLKGRMLLPGFHDAHVHPVSGGVELAQCNLNDLPTATSVVERVRECAARLPEGAWVVGGGWALPVFPEGLARKEALDEATGGRPAYLASADGHSAWVNSKALALGGVDARTADPPNGRIERDGRGEPVGTLREAAMDVVGRHVPPPAPALRLEGLRLALAKLNAFGVTAVQEASASREYLETYREAESAGALTVRVTAALDTDDQRGSEQVDDLVRLRAEFAGARVRPVAAKIFADGVIEGRTAAMIEPYLDRPGFRGEPNLPRERLTALVRRLAEQGFNVHVHAIGDRAIRETLDAMEAGAPQASRPGLRFQVAHAQLIRPEDVPRFRRLGVIANFQPLWAYADSYMKDLTWPALRPALWPFMYPMRSLVRSGAVVAFGSDWSVSSQNPLEGIQVAVTRQSPDEAPLEVMQPDEVIDLPEALAAYTMGAAYAMGLERETGSIEVGKRADLVVLAENLFEVPPRRLGKTRVLLTLLDGRPVYEDPALAR
jgi:predicted amidohydrolase YtcJ